MHSTLHRRNPLRSTFKLTDYLHIVVSLCAVSCVQLRASRMIGARINFFFLRERILKKCVIECAWILT
jgi:hypothetical protein